MGLLVSRGTLLIVKGAPELAIIPHRSSGVLVVAVLQYSRLSWSHLEPGSTVTELGMPLVEASLWE